jgi:hypothetical protein
MDKQLEMTTELRRARGWILGVGILMFAFDMIYLYGLHSNDIPDPIKARVAMYSLAVLTFFIVMFFLCGWRPVVACVLALCGFWALQIYLALNDGTAIFQGILMKVLFTLALIRGIKSANRAEQLKKELAQVFG